MHEPLSRSLRECDEHPRRAAYVGVLHKLEKLVRPIAIFALATPNRSRFLSPQKKNRRTLCCDQVPRSTLRTQEQQRPGSLDEMLSPGPFVPLNSTPSLCPTTQSLHVCR